MIVFLVAILLHENRYFYSPISRSSLKTFEDMTKQSNLKCRTGDVVKAHIHPELVFRRALALANVREEVSVEKVLAYPVGSIPRFERRSRYRRIKITIFIFF
jgi:hypothetical protein